MEDWKKTLITAEAPVSQAVAVLDSSKAQICLVVDDDRRLLGTVTDGDVRRGILRGLALDQPVTQVMRSDPLTAGPDDSTEEIVALMQASLIRRIPLVDARGVVVGLSRIEDMQGPRPLHENLVVLMAGGLGTRLRPLTEEVPKPLIKVGGRPILDTIISNFVRQRFSRFRISVNYKAEMITSHCGDGRRWGAEIAYIHEAEKMGTAGPLALLQERPQMPVIVMNGDVLTKVNFETLLDFHRDHGGLATMCVREYDFQVPYGVVNTDGHTITGITEKPVHTFFVNAGIYVLDPGVFDLMQPGQARDMPDLFQAIIDRGLGASVFPVTEYWADIGRFADLERANCDFPALFD